MVQLSLCLSFSLFNRQSQFSAIADFHDCRFQSWKGNPKAKSVNQYRRTVLRQERDCLGFA